jgi:hypothetical protein
MNSANHKFTVKYKQSRDRSDYLVVLRDREKNRWVFNFPTLYSIVLVGCITVVLFVTVIALVIDDPVIAKGIKNCFFVTVPAYSRSVLYCVYNSPVLVSSMIRSWHMDHLQSSFITDQSNDPPQQQHIDGIVSMDDFEFIWQRSVYPISSSSGGVVFIANGCKRSPYEWWQSSKPFCPNCTGQPMQVRIVQHLVRAGYSVMTMSTVDQQASDRQCWHRNDRHFITLALRYVYNSLNVTLSQAPLFAIGIENGGVFLSQYAESFHTTYSRMISALCLMNSGIWHESFKPGLYPSVIFIDSPRNEGLINYNERVVAKLVQHNISAVQYVTTKQPVTIGYFMNASMNPHESKLLQHFLFREQFIMPMDRVLVKDPSIERNRIELTQVTERSMGWWVMYSTVYVYDAVHQIEIQ